MAEAQSNPNAAFAQPKPCGGCLGVVPFRPFLFYTPMRPFFTFAVALALGGCAASSQMRHGLSTDRLSLPIASASYGGTQHINLIASAAACSTAPCADKSVAMVFIPAGNSGFQLQAPEVTLLVDGSQTLFRPDETEGMRHTVRVVVDGYSFAKLATGRNVAVILGATRLNLPPAALVELRALANRLDASH